jgi:ubiquinone/menaquinone biosynthesis C-methylase UbiE
MKNDATEAGNVTAMERIDMEDCQDALQVALHQQRYDFVLKHIHREDIVLEIGTGTGAFSKTLVARCISYTGLEFDAAACEITRRRLEGRGVVVQGDAQALPFATQTYSAIVCLEVLEHLADYRKGVREIYRCLKSDGRAIISVPYRRRGGKSTINPYHLYEPGEAELVAAFKSHFSKVQTWYQYFEETAFMTAARLFHLRRVLGLTSVYRDLSRGLPSAISKIRIGPEGTGCRLGLLISASQPKGIL